MEDQPVSKQSLQKMMYDYHEIYKTKVINEYCSYIRSNVLKAASEGEAMIFIILSEDILKYISELNLRLKIMFPDCFIEYQELRKKILISWAEEP